jgi:hypothetical protein
VTEGGFRTGAITSFDAPCVISGLLYGEHLFSILPPFSYDYVSASMAFYAEDGARVEVPLPDGSPVPIMVGDGALNWELIVVLREHLRMKADYYLVSPNNRFYSLQLGPEAPIEYRYMEPPLDAYVPYVLNTFEGAPAKVAIYLQMPSLRGVSRVTLSGAGFGGAGLPADGERLADSQRPGGAGLPADGEWLVDSELNEFSLVDWSATLPTWQLPGTEIAYPGGGGAIGTRFIVFILPESYEGARIRLDSVMVEMEDGGVVVFDNSSHSDVTVRIVDTPKLQ